MTSLPTTRRKLSRKSCQKSRLRQLWVAFLQNGLSKEQKDFTDLSGTMSLTNLPDMTSLSVSCRLQNATKYCTKCAKLVRPAKSRIIRLLFSVESPNSDLVYSHTGYDGTSHIFCTSGRHLSKLEKRPNMSPSTASGRILVVRRFAQSNQLANFLFLLDAGRIRSDVLRHVTRSQIRSVPVQLETGS